jgi:hypothetical protein
MNAFPHSAEARPSARATALLLCLMAALLLGGCRSRDVEQDLRLTDVRTGWYDVGVVDGQNKLVPSLSFAIENVSQEPISRVQLNAVFRRVDEPEVVWDDEFIRGIGTEALAAGATGGAIVIRSELGYTGLESRRQMLENSSFVDATVVVFGRHGSRNWARMGEYTIDRRLLSGSE